MVIDAMRTDFIQNSENTSMRYTNKQLQDSNACLFNIQVESPTVTMPRIKAMTTGTVPNFIDVVLNLGCSELKADSLLHQVHDKNGTIVFAGDNTWVKMFPQMFVRPLENFDSLFVNDFYEVSLFNHIRFVKIWIIFYSQGRQEYQSKVERRIEAE